jgi:hypothetical protein
MDEADEFYKCGKDRIGANGLMKSFDKKLVEGAMGAEMTRHLGCGCARHLSY